MMSRRLLLLSIIISLMIALTTSLSILMVESIPSFSHHIFAMAMVKELLQKGHHVHVVSISEPNIKGDLEQNLTYDIFDNVWTKMQETEVYNFVNWLNVSSLYSLYFTYYWGSSGCERITKTKGAQRLLEVVKDKKFDVIVQDLTLHECLYGLWEIAESKPPVVGFMPFGSPHWMNIYVGGSHYRTVRSHMYSPILRPATVWERILNALYFIIDDTIRYYHHIPISQRFAEQYIGHKIRSLQELEKSINIILLNTHPTLNGAIPLSPNILEVAGLHAQMQSAVGADANYPENIRKFLDEAENGVIVISLGTIVMWEHIGIDKINLVVFVLSQLKQRVLWKIDVDISTPIPPNVMTVRWLPQKEVLEHENVRAIWTHGGLHSMQEAIWKGVPLIGTPFCFDQIYNMGLLVAKGAGIFLHFDAISRKSLLHTFEEIIYNKSYVENMKRLSIEFRDRSMPPLDLAIWGIEYTARHPNSNLTSPIQFQSWMEQNLIDVYMIFVLFLLIIGFISFCILKMLYLYLFKNSGSWKSYKDKQM